MSILSEEELNPHAPWRMHSHEVDHVEIAARFGSASPEHVPLWYVLLHTYIILHLAMVCNCVDAELFLLCRLLQLGITRATSG